jgi:hypothetical protein
LVAPRVGGTPLGIEVMTRFEIEPHQRFWGYGPGEEQSATGGPLIGPRARHVETVFEHRRGLVMLRPGWTFSDIFDLGVIGTLNRRDFNSDRVDEPEPAIGQVYDTSQLPGFDNGYTLIQSLLDLRIDTRNLKGATSSGVFFEAFGGGAPPQFGFQYLRYGASITGFIDLWAGDRVLILHASHESVHGEDDEIPIADMPRLGGPRRHRGYDLGRFRDKHTALAFVEYRYPLHELASASLFFEMGSVGRDYLEMAEPESWSFGGGGGITVHTKDTKLFGVQMAYGEGFQVFVTSEPFAPFTKKGEEL